MQTRVYPEVDRETNELFGAISREGSAKPEQDRPTLETSTRAARGLVRGTVCQPAENMEEERKHDITHVIFDLDGLLIGEREAACMCTWHLVQRTLGYCHYGIWS